MEEILNNLEIDDILHTTSKKTNYLFTGRSNDSGIIYSINKNTKTLPLHTINTAFNAFNNGEEINAKWYRNFNSNEYKTRGCNLQVLRNLLKSNN